MYPVTTYKYLILLLYDIHIVTLCIIISSYEKIFDTIDRRRIIIYKKLTILRCIRVRYFIIIINIVIPSGVMYEYVCFMYYIFRMENNEGKDILFTSRLSL